MTKKMAQHGPPNAGSPAGACGNPDLDEIARLTASRIEETRPGSKEQAKWYRSVTSGAVPKSSLSAQQVREMMSGKSTKHLPKEAWKANR